MATTTAQTSVTKNEVWLEKIAKYKECCINILKKSKSVRYASVINSYGRTVTGVIKPGIKPMLSRTHAPNEFFMLSTMISLRKESMEQIGDLEHYALYHKNVIQVLIPLGDDIVYVSLDRKTRNVDGLITRIKKLL